MLELARLDARELVAGSPLADAPIVAVSSKTGAGLDDAARRRSRRSRPRRRRARPRRRARLPIDRVFSMRGFGTVVTGHADRAARSRLDEELVVLPSARRVKVRGLQVHGAPRPSAEAGRRVAVNLGGVDVDRHRRAATRSPPRTRSTSRGASTR